MMKRKKCLTGVVAFIFSALPLFAVNGYLRINTEVGVHIYLDGESKGVTTRSVFSQKLSVGKYRLKAVKGEFEPQFHDFVIKRGKLTKLSLGRFVRKAKIAQRNDKKRNYKKGNYKKGSDVSSPSVKASVGSLSIETVPVEAEVFLPFLRQPLKKKNDIANLSKVEVGRHRIVCRAMGRKLTYTVTVYPETNSFVVFNFLTGKVQEQSVWAMISGGVAGQITPSKDVEVQGSEKIGPAVGNSLDMKFVPVVAGRFRMGSNNGERDEKPVHTVQISRSFWMGKYEVTQAEFRKFSQATGYRTQAEKQGSASGYENKKLVRRIKGAKWDTAFPGDNRPVTCVSWDDATAFCKWLTEKEHIEGRLPADYVYRLPTEAEWEYAARGGAKSRGFKYSGSNNPASVAWYHDNSDWKTHPVGRKQANELGIHDMTGNVGEWCLDWHVKDYYGRSPSVDPVGDKSGSTRIYRGGNWRYTISYSRLTDRRGWAPSHCNTSLGFRVALAWQKKAKRKKRRSDVENFLGMEFVTVEPGSFEMGTKNGKKKDEKPVHSVRISRSFWMGRCEVTQAEFRKFSQETRYQTQAEKQGWGTVFNSSKPGLTKIEQKKGAKWNTVFPGDDRPVVCVSWDDAAAFCKWMTEKERDAGRLPAGYVYRLPTEAEWEYAARGGAKSRGFKYSGANKIDSVAWHSHNSDKETHLVGTKQANELGIYDMSGNVHEWCLDWYDKNYYGSSPSVDPRAAKSAALYYRVLRGGNFRHGDDELVRVDYRNCSKPLSTLDTIGFRCCLAPE